MPIVSQWKMNVMIWVKSQANDKQWWQWNAPKKPALMPILLLHNILANIKCCVRASCLSANASWHTLTHTVPFVLCTQTQTHTHHSIQSSSLFDAHFVRFRAINNIFKPTNIIHSQAGTHVRTHGCQSPLYFCCFFFLLPSHSPLAIANSLSGTHTNRQIVKNVNKWGN